MNRVIRQICVGSAMLLFISSVAQAIAAHSSNPSTATRSFSYNAFGARVSKTDSSGTATYARNGVSVIAPVLSDGSLTYTPGISSRDGSNSTFTHGDIKNSLRQTAENESTSATKQYDAFGNEITSTGTWQGPFQYGGPFGYQSDADSGLKLLGHRYYDSSTGRFLSRDVARDGRNWYSYCHNNPVRYTDPDGLSPGDVIGGIGVAISWGEFVAEPSVSGLLWAIADTVTELVPIIPGTSIRHGKKILDKIGDVPVSTSDIVTKRAASAVEDVAEAVPHKGGVYVLRDKAKVVRYVGESGDLKIRMGQWAIDPVMGTLKFEPWARSDDVIERRLWEQQLIEMFGGPNGPQLLNKRNAVAKDNPFYSLIRQ